ncbi:MAG: Holliday junction branch migration protein RuvA [Rhodospirillales bacterium]|nr:Holliday junction branch migration protein RuvA [Rhodospirillales bacterium]
MIARLKGIVERIGDDWVILDVNGVGYLAFCSGKTLSRLAVGEAAALEIETHVREDHIHLYGFADENERDWFRLLTSVQGVGAKVGLAILGVLSGDELLQTIAAADKAGITRAPGVGPKLATRILSELKDKVGNLALGTGGSSAAAVSSLRAVATAEDSILRDAASALVNLGYAPADALGAVSRAGAAMSGEPTVQDLIRAGLRELAPAET